MKGERSFERVGYLALTALLAVVFACYWVARRIDHGDVPAFLTEKAASVVGDICTAIAYVAFGFAVFIIIRAFCTGLRGDKIEQGEKHTTDDRP